MISAVVVERRGAVSAEARYSSAPWVIQRRISL
jgi:hypothetical protein